MRIVYGFVAVVMMVAVFGALDTRSTPEGSETRAWPIWCCYPEH